MRVGMLLVTLEQLGSRQHLVRIAPGVGFREGIAHIALLPPTNSFDTASPGENNLLPPILARTAMAVDVPTFVVAVQPTVVSIYVKRLSADTRVLHPKLEQLEDADNDKQSEENLHMSYYGG
jgi:hypothetical protein